MKEPTKDEQEEMADELSRWFSDAMYEWTGQCEFHRDWLREGGNGKIARRAFEIACNKHF